MDVVSKVNASTGLHARKLDEVPQTTSPHQTQFLESSTGRHHERARLRVTADIVTARDGILAFADKEILPGTPIIEIFLKIPEQCTTRTVVSRQDYKHSFKRLDSYLLKPVFTKCVSPKNWGRRHGSLSLLCCWQALFHRCGPQNWLMLYALAHWAFGPSKLLEQVTQEAQRR